MDIKELRQKSSTEIKATLDGLRDKIRDLRFKIASKQVKNVREIREAKKTVSRILTLLKQKTKAADGQSKPASPQAKAEEKVTKQ